MADEKDSQRALKTTLVVSDLIPLLDSETAVDADKNKMVAYGTLNRYSNDYYVGQIVGAVPTSAEIDSIVGETAAEVPQGYRAGLADQDSGSRFLIMSDGNSWEYITFAAAV